LRTAGHRLGSNTRVAATAAFRRRLQLRCAVSGGAVCGGSVCARVPRSGDPGQDRNKTEKIGR
jgi:hypothetical protein